MKITIETIPHGAQRYPTVGDWTFDADGSLTIKVSKLSDWRYEMLVAVHELVEVLLCKQRGITQEMVDKFDIEFETCRHLDQCGEYDEPGDEPGAPYHKEHVFATNIEALLAAELGVEWNDYEKEVESLP